MCADRSVRPPTKAELKELLRDVPHDDVYDAHSRASSVDVPASLLDHSLAPHAERVELSVPGVRAFSVTNLLSAAECDALVASLDARGFDQGDDIRSEYPPEYRNSKRLIAFSKPMAETVFRRLVGHLTDAELMGCKPMGWQVHVSRGMFWGEMRKNR